MIRRRREVEPAARAAAAQAIADRLLASFAFPANGVVSGYWPLAGELDPRPAMAALAARGHPLALPRVQGHGQPLALHRWQPGTALVAGQLKLQEPAPEAPLVDPDIVLAPLLAFDRRGHRLGYGKGYYDRTLARLRPLKPQLLVIGLALAVQEVAELPADDFDQPLDAVVTEQAVHRPGAAA